MGGKGSYIEKELEGLFSFFSRGVGEKMNNIICYIRLLENVKKFLFLSVLVLRLFQSLLHSTSSKERNFCFLPTMHPTAISMLIKNFLFNFRCTGTSKSSCSGGVKVLTQLLIIIIY